MATDTNETRVPHRHSMNGNSKGFVQFQHSRQIREIVLYVCSTFRLRFAEYEPAICQVGHLPFITLSGFQVFLLRFRQHDVSTPKLRGKLNSHQSGTEVLDSFVL